MKHASWIALGALVIGCSGSTTEGTVKSSELKARAAAALAAGTAVGDPCAANRWYGDGECDTFCPNKDTDCVQSGGPVVCAQFVEASDGKCSRPANDPCIFQDPDCTPNPIPGAGGAGGGGVVCAMIVEVSDGKCTRPADDPCRFQDPDCSGTTPPKYDCDISKVTCQTFAPVVCPDGQVPTYLGGCYGPCVAKSECAPIACDTLIEAPDGICSRPPTDPCIFQDPDCGSTGGSGGSAGASGSGGSGGGTICAMYIEAPDGVCSRPANDPCIFQDPDCKK